MMEINDLLANLSSRLPELEWKISGLGSFFSSHSLPRGLFRIRFDMTGAACVDEIKSDIKVLACETNKRSAAYLATRIQQKINVLVILCQMHSRKKKPEERLHFGLNMLSTRSQWIRTLEQDIDTLVLQQQALHRTLEQMKPNAPASSLLSIRGELGDIEKRLTLAQEALTKAVS